MIILTYKIQTTSATPLANPICLLYIELDVRIVPGTIMRLVLFNGAIKDTIPEIKDGINVKKK
jgi:hypothetical protein